MPKGIALGTLSGDGVLTHNVEGFSSDHYSVLLTGSFGGGTLAIKGGDGTTNEAINVTGPDSVSTAIQMTLAGLYTFAALCKELEFDLSGSVGPSLAITLFPAPRSYHAGRPLP
jgi:hypothetical protein